MSMPTKIIYLITFLISTTLIHNFKHFVLSPETERAFDSTITIYPYSRPSIQESGMLTITTFGDCRVNDTQVDIGCSVAVRDLIDRGPYLTGHKGTGEERWVLGRLWWLRVGFHICKYLTLLSSSVSQSTYALVNASLVLSCITVYLEERSPSSMRSQSGGRKMGLCKARYRKLAILFCSIASITASLVSVCGPSPE